MLACSLHRGLASQAAAPDVPKRSASTCSQAALAGLGAGKKGWGAKLMPAAARAETQLRGLWDKRPGKPRAPHLGPPAAEPSHAGAARTPLSRGWGCGLLCSCSGLSCWAGLRLAGAAAGALPAGVAVCVDHAGSVAQGAVLAQQLQSLQGSLMPEACTQCWRLSCLRPTALGGRSSASSSSSSRCCLLQSSCRTARPTSSRQLPRPSQRSPRAATTSWTRCSRRCRSGSRPAQR